MQQEECCARSVHQWWVDWWRTEVEDLWTVLAAAAAAADVEVDEADETSVGVGQGGTDPGNDHGGGSSTGNDGSSGQSGQGDDDWSAGGLVGDADDGGGTRKSGAGWGTHGEWIGEGGGWRVGASPVKGKTRGEVKREGARGGRRRRGARRKREQGWRRWLRRREPVRGYPGRTGGEIASLCLPAVEVSRTGMGPDGEARWRGI